MAFFRTASSSEQAATIEGTGVVLRSPQLADFEEWATLREAIRSFLTPWEPTWPIDDLTRGDLVGNLLRQNLDRHGEIIPFPRSFVV